MFDLLPIIPCVNEGNKIKPAIKFEKTPIKILQSKKKLYRQSIYQGRLLGKVEQYYYYCIDLDIKDKLNTGTIKEFEEILEEFLGKEFRKNTCIQKTKSNGRHYLFKSRSPVFRYLKNNLKRDSKVFVFDILGVNIGKASFVFAYPTPGYEIINNCKNIMNSENLPNFLLKQCDVQKKERVIHNRASKVDEENLIRKITPLRDTITNLIKVLKRENLYPYSIWFSTGCMIAGNTLDKEEGGRLFLSFSKSSPTFTGESAVYKQYNHCSKERFTNSNASIFAFIKSLRDSGIKEVDIKYIVSPIFKEIFEQVEQTHKDFVKEEIPKKDFEALCYDMMKDQGLFGKIARHIYNTYYPSIASYSVFTAIACLSVISQYEYTFASMYGKKPTQLNLFVCLLGKTSSGKNEYKDFFSAFCRRFGIRVEPEASSSQGLGRLFQKDLKRSFAFSIDEYLTKTGKYLRKPRGSSNSDLNSSLKATFSELYSSTTFSGSATKHSDGSIERIDGCLCTIYGVSTPYLDDMDLEQGLVNRHLFVMPTKKDRNTIRNLSNRVDLQQEHFFKEIESEVENITTRGGKTGKGKFMEHLSKNGLSFPLTDDQIIDNSEKAQKEEIEKEREQIRKTANTFFPDVLPFEINNPIESIELFEKYQELDFNGSHGYHERLYLNACRIAALITIGRGKKIVSKDAVIQACDLVQANVSAFYEDLKELKSTNLSYAMQETITLRDKIECWIRKAWEGNYKNIPKHTEILRSKILFANKHLITAKKLDDIMIEISEQCTDFVLEFTVDKNRRKFKKVLKVKD